MNTIELRKIYEDIGITLRNIRKQRGLTLEELADRCGRDWSYLSQIERARSVPSIETLARIAEVLEVPLSKLLSGHQPVEYKTDPFINRIKNLLKDAPPKDKKFVANFIKRIIKKR